MVGVSKCIMLVMEIGGDTFKNRCSLGKMVRGNKGEGKWSLGKMVRGNKGEGKWSQSYFYIPIHTEYLRSMFSALGE
jgi:hypothetical protein